jgi:hypothetical protein
VEDLAAVVNWSAMMTTEAAEVAAAAAAADGHPAAAANATMDAAKEDDKAVFEDGATMVATMENEDEVSKARIMGASSLLLMGRVEPDREVVGTIEESQAMETDASAVLRSMAAVAPKGVVVEAMEVAFSVEMHCDGTDMS